MKKILFALLFLPIMFLWFSFDAKASEGSLSPDDAAYYLIVDKSDGSAGCKYYFTDAKRVCLALSIYDYNHFYDLCFMTGEDSFFISNVSGRTDLNDISFHFGTNYFIDMDYNSSSYNLAAYNRLVDPFSTNLPIFSTYDEAKNFLRTGDDTGNLNVPPAPPFDPYNNDYSDDIPAPEIYRDGDKIMFSNSSPDMLLLANIRWYSVDDITLFKESLSWKYRPDSIIHSDLEWLLTVDEHYSSVNGIDLYTLGDQSFQKFLSAYPVDGRTYLGGTNALGNYLFGYNDALSSLKMILGQIDSSFNAPELFFRYYVPLADGTYKCGKWTKYFRSLPSGASDGAIDGKWNVQYQVSDAPLTSDDVIGSKPNDTSGMTTYTSKDNSVVVDFDSPDYTLSIDNLNQITSLFGQFPTFVSTVFSFLPSWILSLIGCTITLLVGLAVYHALRG